MGEDHAAAAVALQADRIEGVTVRSECVSGVVSRAVVESARAQ